MVGLDAGRSGSDGAGVGGGTGADRQADSLDASSAAHTARRYPLKMTREEVGQAIDGVAKLVDFKHREAAPLLHRLQELYRTSKELEPDAD